ncbi:curli-like amyloid fiber formation chaperone CsgH [Methylobacterium sp. 13MFTsu3.1M2]|uniref:curli-like amyloid fiber formation chaperone CsgH n=1 Tax=Methylobacterium sp. 13MFTsu3.1M2 TaxID=1502776 RepID=UPI0011148D3C|nr:curli-like amyloid fiber formation chaperone CsgH [Methylobacterium sp. 13MFTsu3.1M2]
MPSFTIDPPILCRVVEARSADFARLSLRIDAPPGTAGHYNLIVRKADSAGTTTMQQGGDFDLAESFTREVGKLTVSVRPDGQLSVEASVQVGGRKISCAYDNTQNL